MHALHNIKIKSEIASGFRNLPKNFRYNTKKKKNAAAAYSPDQVFNADETVLF